MGEMLNGSRKNVFVILSGSIILYFLYKFTLNIETPDLDFLNFINDTEEEDEVSDFPRNDLPWYFKNGRIRPSPKNYSDIWPNEAEGDRITNQLMYAPKESLTKIIKIHAQYATYLNPILGWQIFNESKCPVDSCVLVGDKKEADAVIYQLSVDDVRDSSVPFDQIWILYSQESPFHSGESTYVNWTMTYRQDSDVVLPSEKWVYYNESVKAKKQEKNYAKGKSEKVAWFVSNCWAKNDRAGYAKELKKYIDVDIYGRCGDMSCPREESKCLELLKRKYKFYLAFENSNCRDYITEKLFVNALQNNVLPIVMGAHPDDYEKVAPYKSYIHVDHYSSPKELAEYLHELDKNDPLYNSYFQWKGTGEFINTRLYCRLCAMLHSNRWTKTYDNFMDWWNKPGICISGSWYN